MLITRTDKHPTPHDPHNPITPPVLCRSLRRGRHFFGRGRMSDEVTLKIRMPPERYIALRHLANVEGRSMNGQVNYLISQALLQVCAAMKQSDRGHNGASEEDE